jgi:hypothetical protein
VRVPDKGKPQRTLRVLPIAGGSAVVATRRETGGRDSIVVTLGHWRARDDRDPVNPFGAPQSNTGFRYAITVFSFDARDMPRPASSRAQADADSVAATLRASAAQAGG